MPRTNSLITPLYHLLTLTLTPLSSSAAAAVAAAGLAADTTLPQPSYTKLGCYTNQGSLIPQGIYPYQSPGHCEQICWQNRYPVAALMRGNQCFCGDEVPGEEYRVEDKGNCDVECAGYPVEICGFLFLSFPFPFPSIL